MGKEYLQSNGKLLMTSDGKLVQVPDPENLNDLADEQAVLATLNLDVSKEIEDLIVNGVIDGSPKGVYADLSSLQTAFPDGASGVYLTSDNGHWYYWNGSTWTDGGVYQAPLNQSITVLGDDYKGLDLGIDGVLKKIYADFGENSSGVYIFNENDKFYFIVLNWMNDISFTNNGLYEYDSNTNSWKLFSDFHAIGNMTNLKTNDKTNLVNAINECVDSIDDINCDKDINNSTYWVIGNFDSGIVVPNKTPLRAITVNPIPSNVKVITCDDGYGMQIAVRDNNDNPLGYYDCNDDLIDLRSITNFAKVFYTDILPSNYKIYVMVRPSDGSVGKIEDWKHCHLYVDNSVNKEELYNRFYEGKPIDLKKNGFYSCSLFDLNDIGVTTSEAPQDIAIYNDKLFCVYNKGELAIVDLKTNTLVNKFNLSCYSENNHANTMCFGTKFNSSDDTYPLLYVSESNTPNNYCYVVKITESGSETIQTIKFTNGNNDYKGRIYYLIDDLTGYMYTYGSTITNPAMNPNNKIMIKKFNTPDLSIESVEITENDVLEEWYLEDTLISGNTIIQSIQGATIHNGVLYLLDGNTSSKRTLFVFDLCTHEMLSKLSLDYIQYEPEGISIYEDKIIISFYVGSGRLYSFKFN